MKDYTLGDLIISVITIGLMVMLVTEIKGS